jgi:hypothetical protein
MMAFPSNFSFLIITISFTYQETNNANRSGND